MVRMRGRAEGGTSESKEITIVWSIHVCRILMTFLYCRCGIYCAETMTLGVKKVAILSECANMHAMDKVFKRRKESGTGKLQ